MSRIRTTLLSLILAPVALGGLACQDPVIIPPRSLEGPGAIGIARGDQVCLRTSEGADGVVDAVFGACDPEQRSAIGLVANSRNDRLALIDMTLASPRLVDLDPAVPGVTHLPVGRLPVDVGASPDGTVAYTLNQLDRDVSFVNLWEPGVLEERFRLPDTPIAMAIRPASDDGGGEIAVALSSPSRLLVRPGVSCESASECTGVDEVSDTDIAEVELAGTAVDLVFTPDGDDALVIYRDRAFLSVVGFGADAACLDGGQAPCVVAEVGLSYGCSDGVDDDGDGLVDAFDPQCYGPLGAESPEGIGRATISACSNGEDDDEDGLIDRFDPDCVISGGDSEETSLFEPLPVTACNDGIDDDGDGLFDYPDDPDCYGPFGRNEAPLRAPGFDAIGIDDEGAFAYVVDTAGDQVLVVDVARRRLVDAAAAAEPDALGFSSRLGIPVSSSPLSVTGFVSEERDALGEDEPDRALQGPVTRIYGAWVSADNGFIQQLEVARVSCESVEAACEIVPAFPLEPREDFGECELPACSCEGQPACPCEEDPDFLARRFFCEEGGGVLVNPRFTVTDLDGTSGRVTGGSVCEIPDEMQSAIDAFQDENPTSRIGRGCDSVLLPQPLELGAPQVSEESDPSQLQVAELARATLIQRPTVTFGAAGSGVDGPVFSSQPFDIRLRSEGWEVTYEGVLPDTDRNDGLFAEATSTLELGAAEEGGDVETMEVVELGVGGADLCEAGVEVGDVLIVVSEPNDACPDLQPEEGAAEDFLNFRIVAFSPDTLTVAPMEAEGFATELPTRECFDTAVSFEVRAADEWVVVGDQTGFVSGRETRFGACVPAFAPGRANGRVNTGETFLGPYLGLELYAGFVPPARGLSYQFSVEPNFSSLRFNTGGLIPSGVMLADDLGGPLFLMAVDPSRDFVYLNDLDEPGEGFLLR